MRYFPLKDRFEHQFGIRALASGETFVEATEKYHDEIKLKRELLDQHLDQYFVAIDGTIGLQQEAAALIADAAPFIAEGTNTLSGEAIKLDPERPLESIARHVQEDLAIMSGEMSDGFPLVAGCVTFPSGWSVTEKLGKSILAIHAPVPEFDRELQPPTERLMESLKPGRPVWRMNWGVRPTDQLDQSLKHAAFIRMHREQIDRDNVGDRCYFRVERQTLARLPVSEAVLFAIHTHQCPLAHLSPDERQRLLSVLKTMPATTLKYKGLTELLPLLMAYLAADGR